MALMVGSKMSGQRLLLFYCSFTCIYFPCILLLLKFNDTLYNVGTYKFIPILLILMLAEVIKLSFSFFNTEPFNLGKLDTRPLSGSRLKRPWSRAFREVIKFLAFMLILSLVYYTVIVLFGAPLSTHHEETTMLTVTLSTLTFVSPSIHLGVDTALALILGAQSSNGNYVLEAMNRNIKLSVLGAWLGAIVLPLDWDRPWQAWPIPCIIGALLGYMTAHYITLVKMLPLVKFWKLNRKIYSFKLAKIFQR